MPRQKRSDLSRREALFIGSLLGCGIATLCSSGATAGLLWLAGQKAPITPIPASGTPPMLSYYPRSEWGALPPDHNAPNENGFYSPENPEGWRVYQAPLEAIYRTVVIHHSVIIESDDIRTLQAIQRLHRLDRGWADVAYHYFIGIDGAIYEGRDIHVRGTHVGGYNSGSVGICLLGNFMAQNPNAAQINSAHTLIQWLTARLQLTHLAAHRDFNAQTECPGDAIIPYLDLFAEEAKLTRGIDGYQPPHDANCFCGAHL